MPAGRSVRLVSLREVNALQASCPGCLGAQFGNHVARGFPLATRFQTPAALCAGWFGTDDEDPAPRLLPSLPPPVSGDRKGWAPHASSLGFLFCPGLSLLVQLSGCGRHLRHTRGEPGDPNPPGCGCRKPPSWQHAFQNVTRLAPTRTTLAVPGWEAPSLLRWGGCPLEVLDPVASGGGELPRPPDPWDGESGRVFKMLCPLRGRGDRVSCTSFRAPCSAGAGGRGCRPRVPGQAGLRVVKQVCPPGPSLLLLAPPRASSPPLPSPAPS